MLITCPGCAATYEVPADHMSSDKKLRCAHCGTQWRATGRPAAADPEPDPDWVNARPWLMEQAAPDDLAPSAVPERQRASGFAPGSRTALRAAWIASFLVLVVALGTALYWRGAIMRAWPPSIRLLGPSVEPPTHHPASSQGAAAK